MAHPFSRLSAFGLLLVALIVSSNFAIASGPAAMVKDINTSQSFMAMRSSASEFFIDGTIAYYFDLDLDAGIELWRSDGSEAGTYLLKDINPGEKFARMGSANSVARFIQSPLFTKVGADIFFIADNGSHGVELWKTNGTSDGTLLVKDIWLGADGSYPKQLTFVGNRLFFLADDGEHGSELWVSDGSKTGTHMVIDLSPGSIGSYGYGLRDVDGTLFLIMYSTVQPTMRFGLWKSDGTAAGTILVQKFDYGAPSPSTTSLNGLFFFVAPTLPDLYNQLWRSDGSTQGTFPITTISSSSSPFSAPQGYVDFGEIVPFEGAVYFSAGNTLWRTTGLTNTTTSVLSSVASQLTVAGNRLFFAASGNGQGYELWMSDGSVAGTTQVKDIRTGSADSNPYRFVPVGSSIRFSADDGTHGRELWTSDGTSNGTLLVKDIWPGATASLPGFTTSNDNDNPYHEIIGWGALASGKILFTASDTQGQRLWCSDGTPEGTTAVINTPLTLNDANIRFLSNFRSQLFFSAWNSSKASRWLWRSDGTEAGTSPIAQMNGYSHAVISNTLLFESNGELWRSDGTPEGTSLVKSISDAFSPFTQFNVLHNTIYFIVGNSIWRSDGSETGTYVVANLPAINLQQANGMLYFGVASTVDGSRTWNLWQSDGTSSGTVPLHQIGGQPYDFVELQGNVFFYTADSDFELWKIDGSTHEVALVTSIPRDTYVDRAETQAGYLRRVGDRLFFTTSDETFGKELWVSDGSAAGTHLVKDILPGQGSSSPQELTNVNGVLYFTATTSEEGRELWRSDGTEAGTTLVKDINPGASGSNANQLLATDVGLFFAAADAAHGAELWRSDGTQVGTTLAQDINPGPANAISGQIYGRDPLFFQASDGVHGHELWSLRLQDADLPTETSTHTATATPSSGATSSPTSTITPSSGATPSTTPTMTITPTGPTVSGRNRALLPFVVLP